ncbi:MAG: heavy-metal-associated domain-containing protein [Bacteroidetes bacterium]|nr:heavy-metal-associated domain-containing protein [Bacteroidota bacterium]MCH7975871.1 heavy-metal-associated domain-containing protein [Bacteroidota bacterium]
MALAQQASAQDDKLIEDPDIIIEVDGIACPFCAYGIEKRLKRIDGVAELSVLLEEGRVQLKMDEGATVSEERLREAVAEAGFEARSIVFVNEEVRTSSGVGR